MGDNPASISVYHAMVSLGEGQSTGSGNVMRLDMKKKGSNRMGDEDGRRYNDQVLTGRPLGP